MLAQHWHIVLRPTYIHQSMIALAKRWTNDVQPMPTLQPAASVGSI